MRHYHPLFKRLTYQASEMIFQKGAIMRLKSAQVLFKEGSQDLLIYIILSGKIIIRNNDQGILGVIGPTESIGEESYLVISYRCR